MRVDFKLNNIVFKKQQQSNQIITNKTNTTNSITNDSYNNLFFPKYFLTNLISFKGNANQVPTEDKTPMEIEEEKLTGLLIKPALENKPLPSAILLYSEDDKKAAALIEKVSKKANLRIVEFDTEQNSYRSDLLDILKNSGKNYFEKNQRTIVLVKNSDLFLSDIKSNYENIVATKNWMENCSKTPTDSIQNAFGATLIFETSNPQTISPEILKNNNLNGFINISMSSIRDIEKIITSFIESKGYQKGLEKPKDEKLKEISQQLSPNARLGGYSDDRIFSMLNKALIEWDYQSNTDFIGILKEKIKTTRRDILPRIVNGSFESRKWLIENHWIEAPDFKNIDDGIIDNIISSCRQKPNEKTSKNELSQILEENNAFIQNAGNYDFQSLKDTTIKNTPLVDLWLDISGDSIVNRQNARLKNMWFNEVLADTNKTTELISKTIAILGQENENINFAKTAYEDILENDITLTPGQKTLLTRQQGNLAFFNVITSGIKPSKIIELEDRILSTLQVLSEDENKILSNAKDNIFEPAKDIMILSNESADDALIASYIFQLLSQCALNGDKEQKENLQSILQEFNLARCTGDMERLNLNWQKMVSVAQKYFNETTLSDLTNRNIILLNSITEKRKDIQDKIILKLLDDSSLTLEQRDFIARYAQDNNFKLMIRNQNIDLNAVLENLVFFEASNKSLLEQTDPPLTQSEFNKMMSDKFKEIDRNAKDVNIQGNKIASKLDSINESLNSQNDTISKLANSLEQYSGASLSIQLAQFDELIKISQNTDEIRRYTQTLTRAKLMELEKDKYYKEIIPQLTSLLPQQEQFDIRGFLSEVDLLIKKEKNAIKRKKLIKTAAVIAGTAAAGAAVYYFGPTVIAHLFSQVANPAIAVSTVARTAADTELARRIGNSGLINNISFGKTESNKNIETALSNMSTTGRFGDIIKEIKDNPNKTFSITDIKAKMTRPADRAAFDNIVRDLKKAGAHFAK